VNGLDRRSFFTVEPQRQSEQHLADVMGPHQILNVGDVAFKRTPFEGFQRLGGPAKLIAQRNADPLRAVI